MNRRRKGRGGEHSGSQTLAVGVSASRGLGRGSVGFGTIGDLGVAPLGHVELAVLGRAVGLMRDHIIFF